MPAIQKSQLNSIKKLGVIAGSGQLPERLLDACETRNIETFTIAFEGQTDPHILRGRHYMWAKLGATGQILNAFKAHEIKDLVLIGAIRRPSLLDLRPDIKTLEFFARMGLSALGDNNLLGLLRKFLEEEGFSIHGVHRFAEDLVAAEGLIGKYKPKKGDLVDIHRGLEISTALGVLDIGQAVIVQEGIVLGVEAAEGTDELIQRCKHLKRKGRGGVLVKTCKPQQDRDFDLPTIGPQTIRNASAIGLAGVVIHAGHSLLLDPQETARIADESKMFVLGVDPDKPIRLS